MLTYTLGAVTKNAAEKKINSLLDFMSSCQDTDLLLRFYQATLESDEGRSDQRLWVKTNLKLCDLYFQTGAYGKLEQALAELQQVGNCCSNYFGKVLSLLLRNMGLAQLQHARSCCLKHLSRAWGFDLWTTSCFGSSCVYIMSSLSADTLPTVQKITNQDGTPDLKKATLLLEVYAIEMQMCSAQKNFKRLKELYDKSLSIKAAIPHPKIMGIIRENGGKMHMREKAWEAAHTDFFEAFKSYDDAGSARRCALHAACLAALNSEFLSLSVARVGYESQENIEQVENKFRYQQMVSFPTIQSLHVQTIP
jgi:hypothetical protein